MDRNDVTLDIQEIARNVFRDPRLVISDSLSPLDTESWTSLSFMELLKAIEDKYRFKFKVFELIKLNNMGAIIDATMTHLNV